MLDSEYYYFINSARAAFGNTPTGQLDIVRLLQGLPFWRMPNGKKLRAKKTLLLSTDCSHLDWDKRLKFIAGERIYELKAQGFNVYVETRNGFRLFTLEHLFNPPVSTGASPNLLEKAARSLALDPLALLVLTPTHLQQLIQNDDEDWKALMVLPTEGILNDSNISTPSLNRCLQKHGEQLKQLDLRGCLNLTPDTLGKHLPSLLEFLALGKSEQSHRFFDDATLIMKAPDTVTHMSPQDMTRLVSASAKTLRYLVLQDTGIDSAALGDLLRSTSELELLDLSHTTQNIDDFGSAIALPKLRKLNLHNVNISALGIRQLLEKTEQLDNLNLTGCRYLPQNLSDCCDFSHLKKLFIGHTDISANEISKIIAQTKQLQMLNLLGCSNLTGDFDCEFTLPFLKELDLGHLHVSSDMMKTLLAPRNTSRLKTLLIDRCLAFKLSPLSTLPELESLKLDGATLDSAMLDQFLNAPKGLKQLSLFHATFLQSDWGRSCDWSSLKYLNLSHTNIEADKIGEILTKTVALEELHLSKFTQLPVKEISTYKLSRLQKLVLNEIDISSQLLQEILKGASNLKNLLIMSRSIDANPNTAKMVAQLKQAYPQLSIKNAPVIGRLESPSSNLDADTTDYPQHASMRVQRMFLGVGDPHPCPGSYRLRTYNRIVCNPKTCRENHAFTLGNEGGLNLQEVSGIPKVTNIEAILKRMPSYPDSKYYLATMHLKVDRKWQALPSLSPNDKIKAWYWDDPDTRLQINYSLRDDLYYIRSSREWPRTINLEYLLQVPQNQKASELPEPVYKLVQQCRSFSAEPLTMEKSNPTGLDFMNALKIQKKGACRHRTAVFCYFMQKKCPDIPVRIVDNNCHSAIEIKIGNTWQRIELGGYPTHLNIKEPKRQQRASMASEPNAATATSAEPGHRPASTFYFPASPTDSSVSNPEQFLRTILQTEGKVLITANRTPDIASFRQQFLRYCPQPVFYVHQAEDLLCSTARIQIQADGTGAIRPAPGGPLYAFLRRGGKHLLINYANFTTSEIIRFNSLLDNAPRVDGISLPQGCKIIGCKAPDGYDGPDFLARFDQILPLPSAYASPTADAPLYKLAPDDATAKRIELYGGETWQEILLGSWRLKGNQLIFQQGQLLDAIAENNPSITLHNAPWDDDDFISFWQCALTDGGFYLYGQYITLPEAFRMYRTDGYDFRKKAGLIKLPEPSDKQAVFQASHRLPPAPSGKPSGGVRKTIPYQNAQSLKRCRSAQQPPLTRAAKRMRQSRREIHILNGETLFRFFGQYHCDNRGSLFFDDGLLAAHAQQSLSVCVDDSLPAASWAKLLDHCAQYNVQLILSRSAQARFPQALLDVMPLLASLAPRVEATLQSWPGAWPTNKTAWCQSNDPDATLTLLGLQDACIINVSEMQANDLFPGIDAQFDQSKRQFSFAQKEGILTRELKAKKKLVLTGTISASLQQHLSKFLMQRCQSDSAQGELLLIGTKPNPFPMLQAYQHRVTVQDKKIALGERAFQWLARRFMKLEETLHAYPLVKLKAMYRYLQRNPKATNPLNAWQGMLSLPPPIVDNTPILSFQALHQRAENFDNLRMAQVFSVLKTDPFVFISGLTGVGKTSFIQKVWKKRINAELFIGQEQMLAWAQSKNGDRVLFIDEANLSECPISAFEGLFANPPQIVIGNQRYPLGRGHKVIFAGNPLSYGGERQLSPFFERHGNSVVFQVMTPAYIAQKLLLPLLYEQLPFDQIFNVIRPLLDVMVYLTAISESEILITPREITMMALLTASYCRQQNPQAHPGHVAAYYARELSLPLVPEDKKQDFIRRFPAKAIARPVYANMGKILLNDSNRFACHTICDYLMLRQWQRFALARNAQVTQYNGLGGLILEGEPGIGKSELAIESLQMYGLQENRDYILLPASMPLAEKKACLLKAFHAGAIVVMDEINSSQMLEELFNQLLSALDPNGKLPQNPGFMVIGTQNPVHMGGRSKPPPSLQHRMQTIKLPAYDRKAMEAILISKGLAAEQACEMVHEYLAIKAERNLSFRDLLKRAEAEIRMVKTCQTTPNAHHESPLSTHSFFANNNGATGIPTLPSVQSLFSDII